MAEKKNAALDTLLNVLKTSGADAWEVTDHIETSVCVQVNISS